MATNVNFAYGDYSSTYKDANGYWLTIGTYTMTQDIATNRSTIDVSDLTLNTTSGGRFSNYDLNVYLRAEYRLDGSSTVTYKYFFGDADGATVGQKSMPNTTLSLLTTAQIASVVIPHNQDGSRPDLVIRGFVDSPSSDNWVPDSTQAYTAAITLTPIPRGPRIKTGGTWKQTVLYVKTGGVWKIAVPYVKTGSTWKIGGG